MHEEPIEHGHHHHHQMPMKEEWIVPELHEKPAGKHHPHGAIVIEDHSELERHEMRHPIGASFKNEVINNPHGLGLTPSAAYNLMGAYSQRSVVHKSGSGSKANKHKLKSTDDDAASKESEA